MSSSAWFDEWSLYYFEKMLQLYRNKHNRELYEDQCLLDLISVNENISWNTVKTYEHLHWNYKKLSKNPNITWEIIRENPDKHWKIETYMINKTKRTMHISKKNKNKYFKKRWSDVKKNPTTKWDWSLLSLHPHITWEIIRENPDKPWNYHLVTANPNISYDIIQNNHIFEDEDNILMFMNPNILFQDIEKEIRTYYGELFKNPMIMERDKFFHKKFTQSFLREELIATFWHPRNIKKWKDWQWDVELSKEWNL